MMGIPTGGKVAGGGERKSLTIGSRNAHASKPRSVGQPVCRRADKSGPAPSVTNWYRYTAREFDSETGIYFYRARYYDPGSARFLSEDPIGFRGGINSYRYALNNPALLGDPLGLCPPRKQNCDAAFPKDPTTARFVQLVFAEGNGSDVGDAAVASTVVNRANYGNPREFGKGIGGVINKGYQATGNPLFNRVSNANKVRNLDPDNCQRYKNALMGAIAAQQPGGTNTNALFYFDISIDLPSYIKNGLRDGSIVPTGIDGQTGQASNYIEGPYGNPQVFFGYSDYSH